ncbi:hypothetical protein [Rhodovarius lipocyclicus]|uniref:hypothetical protein n=1 Tax=Rhodovarius lipocyclicus TaxID=268410 RepID=UPI0013579876|nr:hypothetical protein [Rhodovarius lipocyclicus]
MALISDLKNATDVQFGSAVKLAEIAQELNALRIDLESKGCIDDARLLKGVIQDLLNEGESLTQNARRVGRGVVDAMRLTW